MIRKLISYVSLLLMLIAAGCAADEPLIMPVSNGEASLNILIPSVELARVTGITRGADIATRANTTTAELKTQEGAMKDIYVIGFRTDEGKRTHFYSKITPEMGTEVDGMYRSFAFDVETGTYNVYIVANFEPSATNLTSSNLTEAQEEQLEEDIKALTAEFTTLPTLTTGLPMSGKQENISVVKGTPRDVRVSLEFLCAKVRLTVIREAEVGVKGATVNGLSAKNVYKYVSAFGMTNSTDKTDISPAAAFSGHYGLGDVAGKEVSDLTTLGEDALNDPLDHLGDGITTGLDQSEANVYQGVVYLPESPVVGTSTPATRLVAEIISSGGYTDREFLLGCNASNAPDADGAYGTTGSQLKRGHFYDIVAKVKGGDIEYSWSVTEWSTEPLAIELAGNTDLWVEKTAIGDAKNPINGEEPYRLPYTSSAPKLSFKSCVINGTESPVFDIRENKDEGVLEVTLNSAVTQSMIDQGKIPSGDDLGFWVTAGTINKWVKVNAIDAKTFFRISPEARYLYISQIINETRYNLWYEYSTNMDDFTLELKDYENANTSKGTSRISIAICTGTEDEPSQLTEEADLGDGTLDLKSLTILSSRSETQLPKSGLIRITVKEPSDQTAFGKKITGTLTGTGKSSGESDKQDSATFEINPSATKYVIHFKSIDADWGAPHIYVYQPLEYNNVMVYDKGKWSDTDNRTNYLNWLEYSFTGNVVFKGWEEELGEVDKPSGNPETFTQAGSEVTGYRVWYDEASKDNIKKSGKYYTNIDLIEEYRKIVNSYKNTACTDCKTENEMLWPGIVMIPEEDDWWRMELPMLAEPGKALIMFANGHDGKLEGKRYPAAGVPGLPLPNFASCEAWFLYDSSCEEDLAFSDYARKSYGCSGAAEYEYYLKGNIFGSNDNDWQHHDLTKSADGNIWTATDVTVSRAGKFGIPRYKKGETNRIEGNQKGWFASTDSEERDPNFGTAEKVKNGGKNWTLPAGTYDFEFDADNLTLKVTKKGGSTTDDKYYIFSYKAYSDWTPTYAYLKNYDDNSQPYGNWPGKVQDYILKSNNVDERVFWLCNSKDLSTDGIEKYSCQVSIDGDKKEANTRYFDNASYFTKQGYDNLPQEIKNWLTEKSITKDNIIEYYYSTN